MKKNLKNVFTTKVREESAYKLDAKMLKAKKPGRRSVEDKKKKLDFEDQNKIWTHKSSRKNTCSARIRTLEHHARFLDALPSQVFTCANQW